MKKILALLLAAMMVLALVACGGGSKAEAPAEAPAAEVPAAEAPAAEAPAAEVPAADAPAADAPAEPAQGEASGEPSGEPSGNPMSAAGEIEITVDGVTDIATFEESDNGDMATKGLTITWQGESYTGGIDKGQYTADDAAAQPIFSAMQAAREAMGAGVPSGEPTEEPAA